MIRGIILFTLCILVGGVSDVRGQTTDAREQAVRSRGRFFSKIAVDRDYGGEWVIARTAQSTAFLDIADWRHPRSRAKSKEPTPSIHILVVPNEPHEHIAKELGGRIQQADVESALAVFRDAKRLAKKLGIRKPVIYANSESRVDVGYLHIHLIGDLPAKKKLPKLK